jgi:hypothetical protein
LLVLFGAYISRHQGGREKFHEELFICFGRAGRCCVRSSVNRKRRRCQADDASSYAPSHARSSSCAPSHDDEEAHDGQKDVTRKWPLHRGHFFNLGAASRRQAKLKHDPEKCVAVFPRDKTPRQTARAFARRSCSIKELKRDDDSTKSHRASGREPINRPG